MLYTSVSRTCQKIGTACTLRNYHFVLGAKCNTASSMIFFQLRSALSSGPPLLFPQDFYTPTHEKFSIMKLSDTRYTVRVGLSDVGVDELGEITQIKPLLRPGQVVPALSPLCEISWEGYRIVDIGEPCQHQNYWENVEGVRLLNSFPCTTVIQQFNECLLLDHHQRQERQKGQLLINSSDGIEEGNNDWIVELSVARTDHSADGTPTKEAPNSNNNIMQGAVQSSNRNESSTICLPTLLKELVNSGMVYTESAYATAFIDSNNDDGYD